MKKKILSLIHQAKKHFQGTHFKKKKLGHTPSYNSFNDIFRAMPLKTFVKIVSIFLAIGVVIAYSRPIFHLAGKITQGISKGVVTAVSKNFGTEMKTDEHGNINVLLIGMGGEQHAGGHLADTIISASFNTKTETVSMVSIPRDFYVYEKGRYDDRINAVFAYEYADSQGNLDIAAQALQKEVGKVLGIDIPYYAIIDFGGFEGVVDSLGGIEVNVPYMIDDRQYPGPNNTYDPFKIEPGRQEMDGETALKYARSRHNIVLPTEASDFSRSKRQQQIIKAVLQKILTTQTLTSPSTIKALYKRYTKMVHTNITADEMVGMLKYGVDGVPPIFSFGLTMECEDTRPSSIEAGCLLIPGVRDDFNGMSVLIPRGASSANPTFYDYLHFFAYMVVEHPAYLVEGRKIDIYNAIELAHARLYRYRNALATKLGGKLSRYGFTIGEIDNAEGVSEDTLAIVYGTGKYQETIKMLQLFVPIHQTWKYEDAIASGVNLEDLSMTTGELAQKHQHNIIELYLGNKFIDVYGKERFNMYKK